MHYFNLIHYTVIWYTILLYYNMIYYTDYTGILYYNINIPGGMKLQGRNPRPSWTAHATGLRRFSIVWTFAADADRN